MFGPIIDWDGNGEIDARDIGISLNMDEDDDDWTDGDDDED